MIFLYNGQNDSNILQESIGHFIRRQVKQKLKLVKGDWFLDSTLILKIKQKIHR